MLLLLKVKKNKNKKKQLKVYIFIHRWLERKRWALSHGLFPSLLHAQHLAVWMVWPSVVLGESNRVANISAAVIFWGCLSPFQPMMLVKIKMLYTVSKDLSDAQRIIDVVRLCILYCGSKSASRKPKSFISPLPMKSTINQECSLIRRSWKLFATSPNIWGAQSLPMQRLAKESEQSEKRSPCTELLWWPPSCTVLSPGWCIDIIFSYQSGFNIVAQCSYKFILE